MGSSYNGSDEPSDSIRALNFLKGEYPLITMGSLPVIKLTEC
jgi:hypothetical protein